MTDLECLIIKRINEINSMATMQSSCLLQSSKNLLSSSTISSENLLSSSTIVLFDSGGKMITPMPLSREVGCGGGQ